MLGVINEKHGVSDVVSLLKFPQKRLGQYGCSGCKQLHVEKSVRVRGDSSVQPKLLPIDSDHRLVKRDMIRAGTVSWL